MNTVEEAAAALGRGELVVLPTDTVYGIAALPSLSRAIRSLFTLKGRREEKAIPVLGGDLSSLRAVAVFDARAERAADAFWPGPLTLVLPRAAEFDHDLGGIDARTIAVRVPASEITRALLREVGPLAVTSANRSGEPPANTVAEAEQVFGEDVAVYIDGGHGGQSPSTVVALLAEPRVLREGAVTEAEVLAVLDP